MLVNNRPVIGILSLQENYVDTVLPDVSYIAQSYVQWTEMAGARVVPVIINQPLD